MEVKSIKKCFVSNCAFCFLAPTVPAVEVAPPLPATSPPLSEEFTFEDIRSRKRGHDGGKLSPNLENDGNKRAKVGDPYVEGKTVFKNQAVSIKAKSVSHKRYTRFSLQDHLYNIELAPTRRKAPLIINISKALKTSLIKVLDKLKEVYAKNLHHQVYVTIIEQKILKGLNSGNYDINTPSYIIANRILSMLYNYLKSYQTLRINPSFKIQIKVLSVSHMAHMRRLQKRKRNKYVHRIFQ